MTAKYSRRLNSHSLQRVPMRLLALLLLLLLRCSCSCTRVSAYACANINPPLHMRFHINPIRIAPISGEDVVFIINPHNGLAPEPNVWASSLDLDGFAEGVFSVEIL